MEEITKQQNISVRIDKNLSNHYLHFKKYTKDDSNLMFLLLAYFSKQRENNLFGFGTFDPIEFCKEMQLNPNHIIWTKHPNPRHFQVHSKEQLIKANVPLFESVLENALFCLANDPFIFYESELKYLHKALVTKSTSAIKSVQFLKEFSVVTTKTKNNQNKKMITYELGETFKDNLDFLFFHAKHQLLSIATKKNYDGLYLLLCKLKNEMYFMQKRVLTEDEEPQLDFEILCDLIEVESDRPSYKKQKLLKAFNTILEFPDIKNYLEIEWYKKNTDRFEYRIKIKFLKEFPSVVVQDNAVKSRLHSKQIFLKNHLYEQFKVRYPNLKQNMEILQAEYIKWLKSPEIDEDLKKTSYITACSRFDERNKYVSVGEFAPQFLKELPTKYLEYL